MRVKEIVELTRCSGIRRLMDGTPSANHLRGHVRELGADFFVCSGQKICGPTGISVLSGRCEFQDLRHRHAIFEMASQRLVG